MSTIISEEEAVKEASAAFESEVGVTGIQTVLRSVGDSVFLDFVVGREAPLYTYALREIQKAVSADNDFRGAMDLSIENGGKFPSTIEASALLTLLTRSTREIAQGGDTRGYAVPYVPFQKREDHQLAQPASHIVRGRRGVGKSTLIKRAMELLSNSASLVAVVDMQSYSTLTDSDLVEEVLFDVCEYLATDGDRLAASLDISVDTSELRKIADQIHTDQLSIDRVPIRIKRALSKITSSFGGNAFVFLDDFHLIEAASQPELLHVLNGSLKGANGWLKVAGLGTLLNVYSPKTRKGLQVPGDAQFISLDLTLENPEAAEGHLKKILEGFLNAVGYRLTRRVIPDAAFRRLAWANAGVPRDFLQMYGRSLEHAQRNKHTSVTISDVNIAIGEFGQQKMDDLQRDARNEANALQDMLSFLEELCLAKNRVNAFLIRTEESRERELVQVLADLRMLHLIHQSITPHRAGERFEAYILDYSLFTGFRRRRNVKEMLPPKHQFKAADLRALPSLAAGKLDEFLKTRSA